MEYANLIGGVIANTLNFPPAEIVSEPYTNSLSMILAYFTHNMDYHHLRYSLVRWLSSDNLNILFKYRRKLSPFHIACKFALKTTDNKLLCQQMIEMKLCNTSINQTILRDSVQSGDVDLVKFIIEYFKPDNIDELLNKTEHENVAVFLLNYIDTVNHLVFTLTLLRYKSFELAKLLKSKYNFELTEWEALQTCNKQIVDDVGFEFTRYTYLCQPTILVFVLDYYIDKVDFPHFLTIYLRRVNSTKRNKIIQYLTSVDLIKLAIHTCLASSFLNALLDHFPDLPQDILIYIAEHTYTHSVFLRVYPKILDPRNDIMFINACDDNNYKTVRYLIKFSERKISLSVLKKAYSDSLHISRYLAKLISQAEKFIL